MLFIQLVERARSLDCDNTGSSIAAKIAMMAITTNNSINVNVFDNVGNDFIFFNTLLLSVVLFRVNNLAQKKRHAIEILLKNLYFGDIFVCG